MEKNLGDTLENATPNQKRILEINSQILEIFNKGFKNNEEFEDQNKQIEFLKLEKQKLIDEEEGRFIPNADQEETAIHYKEREKTDAERAEQLRQEISNSYGVVDNGEPLSHNYNIEMNQSGEHLETFNFSVEGGNFNVYVQELVVPEKKPSWWSRPFNIFKVQVVFKDDKPQEKLWEVYCIGSEKIENLISDINYDNFFKTRNEALIRVSEIEGEIRKIENEYRQQQLQHLKIDDKEPQADNYSQEEIVSATQSNLPSPEEESGNEKKEEIKKALNELLKPYEKKRKELNDKLLSLSDNLNDITKKINLNNEEIETARSSNSQEGVKYFNMSNIGNREDLVYLTIPDSHGFFWTGKESATPNLESFFVVNKKTGIAVLNTEDAGKISAIMNGDADIIISPVIKNYMNVTRENLAKGLITPIQLKLSEAGDKWLLIEKGETADNQNK